MINKFLFTLTLGLFTFLSHSTFGQCTYNLEMYDSYGDGWNGNEIIVSYGSATLTFDTITLATGSFGSHSISVTTGDSIRLYYLGGGTYNNEVSFILIDQGGAPIYSSGLSPSVGYHYSLNVVCLSCYSPISLTSSPLGNSANLSWVETNSATQWIVEWDTAGFIPGFGNSFITSSNPITLTALQPSTNYEFYLRSICSPGDTSNYSVVSQFSTFCASSMAPWIDSVEAHSATVSSVLDSCWKSIPSNTTSSYRWNVNALGGTPSNNTGPVSAHTGTKYFYVEASSGVVNDTAILVTPLVDLSNLTSARLGFYYHMYGSEINKMYIDVFNGITWINMDSINQQQQASSQASWLPKFIDLSLFSGVVQIRFRAIKGAGYQGDISIDDISIHESPSCLEPYPLTALNITPNSAILGWTEMGSATQWEVSWGGLGISPSNGNKYLTTYNPDTLMGLPSDSAIVFYVRSICSPGDTSYWIGPYGFSTPCNIVAPWTDNVSGQIPTANSQIGNCWDSYPSNTTNSYRWNVGFQGGTPTSGTGPANSYSGTKYFYVEASSGSVYDTATLLVPSIDISNLSNPRLSFYYHAYGIHFNKLFVDVYDGTSWVTVGMLNYFWFQSPQTSSQSFWLPKYIDLSPFSGVIMLRFRAVRGNGALGDIAIDEISIDETPTCLEPSNLFVSGISPISAILNWTEVGTANKWQIGWGGNSGANSVPAFTYSTISNPDTLTNLPSDSNLFYTIRSVCSIGDTSSWSEFKAFKTPCNISLPWTEDVESHPSTTNATISNCWGTVPSNTFSSFRWNVAANGGTPSSGTGPSSAHSGSNYFYVEATSGTPFSNAHIYTPPVDLSTLSSPQLKFYYHMFGVNINRLIITVFDSNSFTVVDSIVGQQQVSTQAAWKAKIIDLSSFSGVVKIQFSAVRGNSYAGDIAIDDISIQETPTCNEPTSVSGIGFSSQSAILNWVENGSASQWQIEYGVSGFSPSTGNLKLTNSNPDTLNGLLQNTTYDYYVRSICGPGDSSLWVGPASFTTLCNAINSFPFTESFEDTSQTRNCWEIEYVTGNTGWTFNSGSNGGSVVNAYYGLKNARFVGVSGTNDPITKLVSPLLNISGMTTPNLTFFYAQEDWQGDQNFTKVYYRVSPTSSWVEIWSDTLNVSSWTMVNLLLPNPSASYQIAFEGINNYGRSNVIDEVVVSNSPSNAFLISRYGRSTNSQYSFIEFFNSFGNDYDLTGHKLVCTGVNSTVIDFGTDVTGNLIIPANGFLVLSNNASKTDFQANWNVTLGNNVTYISSGLAEIGNANTFALKLGGVANTNSGVLIDSTGFVPNSGEVTYQLPIGYWSNNIVPDSLANVANFQSDYLNPALISYVFSDGSWHAATGAFPNYPDSTTFSKNATVLRGNAVFMDNMAFNKLGIRPNAGTNIINEDITVTTEVEVATEASLAITGTGDISCIGSLKVLQTVNNGGSDYNGWGSPFSTPSSLDSVFTNSNKCNVNVFEASSQSWKYDYTIGTSISCNGLSTPITAVNAINTTEGLPDGQFDNARGYFVEYDSISVKTFKTINGLFGNGMVQKYVYHSQNGPISNGSKAWNFLSNPYPSSISVDDFLTSNSSVITNAVYIYDNSSVNTSYLVKNNTDNYDMASCQGFFVDASLVSTGSSDTVVFVNSMRTTSNNDFRSSIDAIYLSMSDEIGGKDFTRVYFDNDCSTGLDYKYDALKMSNKIFDFGFLTDNKVLVFNGVPALDSNTVKIPMYFKTNKTGVYTVVLDSLVGSFTGKEVFIKDEKLGKLQNLLIAPYQFSSDSKEWDNRFFLVVGDSIVSSIEGLEAYNLDIFITHDELIISVKNHENVYMQNIQFIDLNGRVIFQKESNQALVKMDVSMVASAIYFVRVLLSNGQTEVQKVFVK